LLAKLLTNSTSLQKRAPVIWHPTGEYGPVRVKINVLCQLDENMVALKREMDQKEVAGESQDFGKSSKAKFGVFGVEMIEKEVKPSGNTGRIYLPLDWVGKHVKIIRLD